jgi:hypothetical protein
MYSTQYPIFIKLIREYWFVPMNGVFLYSNVSLNIFDWHAALIKYSDNHLKVLDEVINQFESQA